MLKEKMSLNAFKNMYLNKNCIQVGFSVDSNFKKYYHNHLMIKVKITQSFESGWFNGQCSGLLELFKKILFPYIKLNNRDITNEVLSVFNKLKEKHTTKNHKLLYEQIMDFVYEYEAMKLSGDKSGGLNRKKRLSGIDYLEDVVLTNIKLCGLLVDLIISNDSNQINQKIVEDLEKYYKDYVSVLMPSKRREAKEDEVEDIFVIKPKYIKSIYTFKVELDKLDFVSLNELKVKSIKVVGLLNYREYTINRMDLIKASGLLGSKFKYKGESVLYEVEVTDGDWLYLVSPFVGDEYKLLSKKFEVIDKKVYLTQEGLFKDANYLIQNLKDKLSYFLNN